MSLISNIEWGHWYETTDNEEIMPLAWNSKGNKGNVILGMTREQQQKYVNIKKLI